MNVHHTLSALWHNSVAKLSPDALILLRFLSFIDAQGGSRSLLLALLENDEAGLNRGLRALREQSLVKGVDIGESHALGTWRVHRLLQEVTCGETHKAWAQQESTWQAFLTQSWAAMSTVFPEKINTAEDALTMAQGVAHGHAFLNRMETISKTWPAETKERCLLLWQAELLARVGNGERYLALYDSAKKNLNRALASYRAIHGQTANHPEIANTLGNLGG